MDIRGCFIAKREYLKYATIEVTNATSLGESEDQKPSKPETTLRATD